MGNEDLTEVHPTQVDKQLVAELPRQLHPDLYKNKVCLDKERYIPGKKNAFWSLRGQTSVGL